MRFHKSFRVPALSGLLLLALTPAPARAQEKPGWQLIWSDEFTDSAINSSKWTLMNGAANVNSELEFYSNSSKNAFIENGSLVLRALKENSGGKNYTSAKMITRMKGDWLYGRIEVRAKLNRGKGIWPAIWMMPTDEAYGGWPSSGEMDIMELLGHDPAKVYGTVHWNGNGHQQQGSSKSLASGTFADDYHVFGYEWDAGVQRWFIDDVPYFTTTRGQPFDKRFYLILNVAVGGGWPGNPDATTAFPNDMSVDFVRIYKKGAGSGIGVAVMASGPGISPNPYQDEAFVADGGTGSDVLLSDLSGRFLQRLRLNPGERRGIGGNLSTGIYFVEMASGGHKRIEKLFKTR